MTTEQMRARQNAKPFQPYTIHMADGRELRVKNPEFLAFSASGRTVSVATSDDAFDIIDLLLVASLEVGSAAPQETRR